MIACYLMIWMAAGYCTPPGIAGAPLSAMVTVAGAPPGPLTIQAAAGER